MYLKSQVIFASKWLILGNLKGKSRELEITDTMKSDNN